MKKEVTMILSRIEVEDIIKAHEKAKTGNSIGFVSLTLKKISKPGQDFIQYTPVKIEPF